MHVLVPLAFLLPIVVELLLAIAAPSFAASLAWLPLRSASRRVVLAAEKDAYRSVPRRLLDRVPLVDRELVIAGGARVRIDGAQRRGWMRLRGGRTPMLLRFHLRDDESGFELQATALPAPLTGLFFGAFFAAVFLVELTGASAFVVPLFVALLLVAILPARVRAADDDVRRVADAIVDHVAAAMERERGDDAPSMRVDAKPESPSPASPETPSTPPPEERGRRSSSSD